MPNCRRTHTGQSATGRDGEGYAKGRQGRVVRDVRIVPSPQVWRTGGPSQAAAAESIMRNSRGCVEEMPAQCPVLTHHM